MFEDPLASSGEAGEKLQEASVLSSGLLCVLKASSSYKPLWFRTLILPNVHLK